MLCIFIFQFPWIVSIGYFDEDVWNHICSGNIVSENAVLTSLDCGSEIFHDPNVQIKMGAQFLNGPEDSDTVSIYDISLVIKGVPVKDKPALDLAYVYTQDNITTNARTRPICMLSFSMFGSKLETPALDNFIWAGWNTSSGEMSDFNFNSTLRFQCQERGNCSDPFEFEEQNLLMSLQTDLGGSGIFKVIDTNGHTFYEIFGVSDHNGKLIGKYGEEELLFSLLSHNFFMYFIDFLKQEVVNGKSMRGLRDFRMDVSTMNPTYEGGTSLLHLAARLDNNEAVGGICEWLERNNQTIIPTDDIGITPVHEAYLAGHYRIARYILQKLDDDLFLQISLNDQNVTEVISQVNDMIDLTERGNFTGDPMDILNKLVFYNDQNQTDLVSPIEMGARILLQEMEIWLDVDGRPNNPPEDSKLNDRRLVDNMFQKLSLMENLSNETLDLVKGVGTLRIKKLAERAEQPGPVTKQKKFIFFILQMLSRNPHLPENVMINLQKIGMWLID